MPAAVWQFSTVWALSQWKQIYFILNILIYFVAICLDSSLTVRLLTVNTNLHSPKKRLCVSSPWVDLKNSQNNLNFFARIKREQLPMPDV